MRKLTAKNLLKEVQNIKVSANLQDRLKEHKNISRERLGVDYARRAIDYFHEYFYPTSESQKIEDLVAYHEERLEQEFEQGNNLLKEFEVEMEIGHQEAFAKLLKYLNKAKVKNLPRLKDIKFKGFGSYDPTDYKNSDIVSSLSFFKGRPNEFVVTVSQEPGKKVYYIEVDTPSGGSLGIWGLKSPVAAAKEILELLSSPERFGKRGFVLKKSSAMRKDAPLDKLEGIIEYFKYANDFLKRSKPSQAHSDLAGLFRPLFKHVRNQIKLMK